MMGIARTGAAIILRSHRVELGRYFLNERSPGGFAAGSYGSSPWLNANAAPRKRRVEYGRAKGVMFLAGFLVKDADRDSVLGLPRSNRRSALLTFVFRAKLAPARLKFLVAGQTQRAE